MSKAMEAPEPDFSTPILPEVLTPLTALPNWVIWRWKFSKRGKPTKVPYQPKRPAKKASITNSKTWSDFATAVAVADQANGIGFCLLGTEFGAFDADNCRDAASGTLQPWAQELVARAGSYTEVTVSGTGLRIIGRATGPQIHRKQTVINNSTLETYRGAERYIAMTGNVLTGAPMELADLDNVMDEVVAELDNHKGNGQLDVSGSGFGFRFMQACHAEGLSEEQARALILTHKDEAGEWANRVDKRQLDRAWENSGDDDIKRLNDVHAVLPIGGKTRVVTFGELEEFPGRKTIIMTQTFGDFAALQNKYRHEFSTPKGVVSIPLGTFWLNSKHRRQFDGGMAFMPCHDERVVGNKLNLWAGYGVQPVEGDCGLFLDFARDVICSGDKEHFEYLIKREAFIMQARKRSEVALALRSKEEGVGKGLYERIIGHLYGNHAMQIANPAHVIGKFNPHLETLLRLTADEALFVGDPRHRNALFGLVTEAKLTIEPKFAGVYGADSFLNLSITTNADHFIPVSGTARRFFVPTVSPCHMQDFAYFDAILKQMRAGGYEALLYHLLHVDLSGFNVRAVPKTAGLAEQAAYSRRGVDGLVEEACSVARVPAPASTWPGFTVTSKDIKDFGFAYELSKTTDPELKRLSPLTVVKRLCKEWGCVAEQRRNSTKNTKDLSRTSGLQWPPLDELRTKFVERFGRQEWQHSDATEWGTD
jgi:hypothetical protein